MFSFCCEDSTSFNFTDFWSFFNTFFCLVTVISVKKLALWVNDFRQKLHVISGLQLSTRNMCFNTMFQARLVLKVVLLHFYDSAFFKFCLSQMFLFYTILNCWMDVILFCSRFNTQRMLTVTFCCLNCTKWYHQMSFRGFCHKGKNLLVLELNA